MKIAFFDSGVGGLTVLKMAMVEIPDAEFIYFDDSKNVPYGTKSKEKVKELVMDAVDFIASLKIDALVIACNTATSIAVNSIREKYTFPVIGMEPAVKPAVEKCGQKQVLVAATPLTLVEQKFQDLVSRIDTGNVVNMLALPKLVEFAEQFAFDDEAVLAYLGEELRPFDLEKVGTIVLGCTHFLFFKDHFRKVIPEHIQIIDGNIGTVRHLKNILKEKMLQSSAETIKNKITFYSGRIYQGDVGRYLKYMNLAK